MRRRSFIAVLAGAGALAAGVAGNVGAQGQGQGQGQADRTIVVYEKGDRGTFKFTDAKPFTKIRRNGPRRISPGDSFFLRNPAYSDAAGTQRAGTTHANCRATNSARRFPGVRWLCDGVIRFGDGGISFHGLFRATADTFTFAAIGGTGAYNGANGQVTIVDQKGGDATITIALLGDK